MLGIGLGLLARLAPDASALDISWRMALCAAGFALFQSPNMNALMTSAPAARSGGASGIVATCRMLGQAMGVALAAACFRLSADQGPTMALWAGCAAAVLASAASLLRLRVRGTPMDPAAAAQAATPPEARG
jgi:DHA2 family multidrug resistance protein-like MFS transporter